MNRIILAVIVWLCSITAFAGKNDIAIKGTITNPLADSVTFSYLGFGDNWLDFQFHSVSEKLDEKGNFIVMLPLSHPYTNINIQNGGQATEIYGSPGDKLVMTVDAADFDATLEYEGIGMKADVANFMAKHVLASGFSNNFYTDVRALTGMEQIDFLNGLDKLVQKEMDFLIDNSKNLPQSFIKFWNAEYEYRKYNAILEYPMMHEIIKAKSYDIGAVPKENYAVIKKVPAKFNDEWLMSQSYRSYASSYHYTRLEADGVGGTDEPTLKDEKMLELAHREMPAKTEEYVYAYFIFTRLKQFPLGKTEDYYTKFSARYPDNDYAKFLEGHITKKKRLSVGSPAIDFTVNDADGNKVKLSELKGKVVYLDFWASWCGPCKAQFPHVKKIKEHFAGKDVVFVYVSIDEDAAAWDKAMEQYKLTGLHTRVDGGWKAKVAEDYGVQGIPAYFLIDRDGNFAADNTPRPSQTEELIKSIEALL